MLASQPSPPNRQHARTLRLSILLFAGYASLIAMFQGVQNILLPILVQRIAPDTKVSTLAILTTISAVATVIALLAGGAVSDRTRSRWGRRTPSLVVAGVFSVFFMLMMGRASTIPELMLFMPLMWFSANYYQTALTAILADRVPEEERGLASSALGLGAPVGIFMGISIAAYPSANFIGYALLTVPFTLSTIALVLLEREPPYLTDPDPQSSVHHDTTSYLSAFANRDFTLTCVSRFALFLAYFAVVGYLFYILQDYVGSEKLPSKSASVALTLVMGPMALAWAVVTALCGFFADRMGHTAKIVAITSVAAGLVMLLPAMTNAWPTMIVFGIGMGLTFGLYFAIDLKLVTLVLPSPQDAGRDIGILAVAGSGPTVFAPAVAAGIISYGGFPALFVVAGITAIFGGVCALFIRIDK